MNLFTASHRARVELEAAEREVERAVEDRDEPRWLRAISRVNRAQAVWRASRRAYGLSTQPSLERR